MKTRAKDVIKLPSGETLTLANALDTGIAVLVESTYYDPPRYFARIGDVSWEISASLYASRTGQFFKRTK